MSPSRVHLRSPGALAICFSSHSGCVQHSKPVFLPLGNGEDPSANRRTTRKPLACLSAGDICGTAHMGTEATHMAYPACEVSHIAGAATEAVRAPSRDTR